MITLDQSGPDRIHEIFRLFNHWNLSGPLIALVAAFIANQVSRLRKARRSAIVRHWPALPAVIDVVSVVERVASDQKHHSGSGNMQKFAGVLTYFYRNPELQVGEYERMFPSKPEAERWVEQFRHRTVMVHVNPARPRDSCVLDSDLEGLDLHLPQSAETAAAVTPSPLIGATYRSLCAFGEIVSTAGIAACAVLLAVRLVTHTNEPPSLFYWLGGAMFAFSAICAIAVWLHLKNDEAGKAFLHTLPQWSPAWLRWSLKVSGLLLGLLPFVHSFSPSSFSFLRPFFKGIAPSLPYLVGCWGFLVTAAFHAAILRSQEEIRASAGGVLEG